ncbi:hypothetical protein QFC24_000757 [Naganishia onofrii]|uniref:Uncharacterized protein n=1 Tax=Naganishia onofrii TaxID=1851511 RepID=A0ACC2XVG7_9TREE|nr:hypothetical protein QFC24_000757 [Naganishia onofrii]
MFEPTTTPSDALRALPSSCRRACTVDIQGWADDVSELAYMNPSCPYQYPLGTYFDHDQSEYNYLSYSATPAILSSASSGNPNNYLPQRTTSLSCTSLPLTKSPLPLSLVWANDEREPPTSLLPIPKRPAPLPPLRSRSRSRARLQQHTSSRTGIGRKWRMALVDPEQVGLWTLAEDMEGQFDDAPSSSPVPPSSSASNPASMLKLQEGHLLWGDPKRQRGAGQDESVRQMVQGTDSSAWVAPMAGEEGEAIGLGLGLGLEELDESVVQSTPRVRKSPPSRPERQFDGLFYVPPVSIASTGTLLSAANAGITEGQKREGSVLLESPMSSEESWGNNFATETTPTIPLTGNEISPLSTGFTAFVEPRQAPPRSLRITTTPIPDGEDGRYAFPSFPDLELGSPFTPTATMTPCRSHTGAIIASAAAEQGGLDAAASPEREAGAGRKRVTSAPAVIHWPDWSSAASSASSVSHSHTSSASSLLSSEGPVTPFITAIQMERVEKRESVVGEDLLVAFERFLMEAHEPAHTFFVNEQPEEKGFLGGDVTVHASPCTPKRNIGQISQPPPPPATPKKRRHAKRALQTTATTPVPRSCEALQFVITTTTAEEAQRVPQTAPCFGGNGRDLVFDFRVVETGRERGVETCRASWVVPTGAEVAGDGVAQDVGGTKGKGRKLPQRSALPFRWMDNEKGV